MCEDMAGDASQDGHQLDPLVDDDEVEELKTRCARLEAQVEALLKRDAATTEQLRTHAQTINGLIAYIGSRGARPLDPFGLVFNSLPLVTPSFEALKSPQENTQMESSSSDSSVMQTEFVSSHLLPPNAMAVAAPRAEVYHRQDVGTRAFLEEPKEGEGVIYSFDNLEGFM